MELNLISSCGPMIGREYGFITDLGLFGLICHERLLVMLDNQVEHTNVGHFFGEFYLVTPINIIVVTLIRNDYNGEVVKMFTQLGPLRLKGFDLKMVFDQYTRVYRPSKQKDYLLHERCSGCICLVQILNNCGTQGVYNIQSKKAVHSDKYKSVPLSDEAIEVINNISKQDNKEDDDDEHTVKAQSDAEKDDDYSTMTEKKMNDLKSDLVLEGGVLEGADLEGAIPIPSECTTEQNHMDVINVTLDNEIEEVEDSVVEDNTSSLYVSSTNNAFSLDLTEHLSISEGLAVGGEIAMKGIHNTGNILTGLTWNAHTRNHLLLMDIETAFLEPEEIMYIQLKEFAETKGQIYFRLRKALYGYSIVHEDEFMNFVGLEIRRNYSMGIIVSMNKYEAYVFKWCECTKQYGEPNNFQLDDSEFVLSLKDIEVFHTGVAKLLFVAKRVRTDILLQTNMLCSRVKTLRKKNVRQLERIYRYILRTPRRVIMFEGDESMDLRAWGNVAFILHEDLKSRSASLIEITGGVVEAHTSKENMRVRSVVVAEFIQASRTLDYTMTGIRFLREQGLKIYKVPLYQDNEKVLALASASKPTSNRIKHIALRHLVDSKDIMLVSENMLADILTKPLVGKQSEILRDMMTKNVVKY